MEITQEDKRAKREEKEKRRQERSITQAQNLVPAKDNAIYALRSIRTVLGGLTASKKLNGSTAP
jgi:hypothetical protein